jgi:hypothetical protein
MYSPGVYLNIIRSLYIELVSKPRKPWGPKGAGQDFASKNLDQPMQLGL